MTLTEATQQTNPTSLLEIIDDLRKEVQKYENCAKHDECYDFSKEHYINMIDLHIQQLNRVWPKIDYYDTHIQNDA